MIAIMFSTPTAVPDHHITGHVFFWLHLPEVGTFGTHIVLCETQDMQLDPSWQQLHLFDPLSSDPGCI